jgi:hypothetical protein
MADLTAADPTRAALAARAALPHAVDRAHVLGEGDTILLGRIDFAQRIEPGLSISDRIIEQVPGADVVCGGGGADRAAGGPGKDRGCR